VAVVGEPGRISGASLTSPVAITDAVGGALVTETANGAVRIGRTGGTVAFYGTTPIALQTGVAVTAGGVHAALVALGLITA
jgi:hypothetical protein